MAGFDDTVNGYDLTTGVVIGAGALMAWPVVSPIRGRRSDRNSSGEFRRAPQTSG